MCFRHTLISIIRPSPLISFTAPAPTVLLSFPRSSFPLLWDHCVGAFGALLFLFLFPFFFFFFYFVDPFPYYTFLVVQFSSSISYMAYTRPPYFLDLNYAAFDMRRGLVAPHDDSHKRIDDSQTSSDDDEGASPTTTATASSITHWHSTGSDSVTPPTARSLLDRVNSGNDHMSYPGMTMPDDQGTFILFIWKAKKRKREAQASGRPYLFDRYTVLPVLNRGLFYFVNYTHRRVPGKFISVFPAIQQQLHQLLTCLTT